MFLLLALLALLAACLAARSPPARADPSGSWDRCGVKCDLADGRVYCVNRYGGHIRFRAADLRGISFLREKRTDATMIDGIGDMVFYTEGSWPMALRARCGLTHDANDLIAPLMRMT